MAEGNSSSSGGIGFFGLLTIVFIILKLLGHIAWGWAWVLAPIWLPITVIVGLVAVVGGGCVLVKCIFESVFEKRGKQK